MRPQKGTSLDKTVLFEPLRIKIGSVVWSVGPVTTKKGEVRQGIYAYISHIWGAAPSQPTENIFGRFSGLAYAIKCANFQNDRSKGFCLVGA
jgi:hypothetical protein